MYEDEILFTEFFNQRLKERGLTLKNLSDMTGIAIKHLEAFGHGRFERLPSAPYVHGYFERLGPILGFEPDEWWDRIKEEDTVHRAGSSDKLPKNRYSKARGRIIAWGAVALALVALYFAARFTTIIGEPRLALLEPTPEIETVTAGTITFSGSIRNGDTLTVDGASVPLEKDGAFRTEVVLDPGVNMIEVRAAKTLGRSVTLTRQIYYDATQVIIQAVTSSPVTP